MTVFGTLPHTHLRGNVFYSSFLDERLVYKNCLQYFTFAGTSVTTKIIRDGKEVDFLTNNKYYDFNFQYVNFLSAPVKLKKVCKKS